jgi:hypothetical protein
VTLRQLSTKKHEFLKFLKIASTGQPVTISPCSSGSSIVFGRMQALAGLAVLM